MKKLFFVLIIGWALVSQAQVEPGTLRVGGNAAYESASNQYFKSRTFQMDAVFGVFAAENFNIGFRVIAIDQYSSFGQWGSFGTSGILLSPEIRYYINGRIIVGALYPMDLENSENRGPLKFEAGYAAFISDKVAFEPIVYYGSQDGVNNVGVQVGFSIFL